MNRFTIKGLTVNGIRPLDLELQSGDCICLSGPSGSGKSLTLRAIADLDPHEGELAIDDKVSTSVPAPQWRRRVGLLTAESQWWADTVAEHFPSSDDTHLSRMGFDEATLGWKVARLSTGEKQRLALARLLANEPEVLLLDEPTAALDKENVARVEALIEQYRKERGAAVLWISHDPEQIRRVSQRHLHLQNGQWEESQ